MGNPDELLAWMGGSHPPRRADVVAPDLPASSRGAGGPVPADVTLDYVGTVANAATVIAALHAGEKRLLFCDSRAQAEALALGAARALDHHLPRCRPFATGPSRCH